MVQQLERLVGLPGMFEWAKMLMLWQHLVWHLCLQPPEDAGYGPGQLCLVQGHNTSSRVPVSVSARWRQLFTMPPSHHGLSDRSAQSTPWPPSGCQAWLHLIPHVWLKAAVTTLCKAGRMKSRVWHPLLKIRHGMGSLLPRGCRPAASSGEGAHQVLPCTVEEVIFQAWDVSSAQLPYSTVHSVLAF